MRKIILLITKCFFLVLLVGMIYYVYMKATETIILDKTQPEYIASKSFIYICDHYTENPISDSNKLPRTYPTKDGELIYIHNTALQNFVFYYLPKIKYKFVLLSGDCDKTIPDEEMRSSNIIVNHPLLITWYAQNTTVINDKLKQLPIGLDYHTLVNKSMGWGKQQSIIEQEIEVNRIRNKSLTITKQNKCYANYHLNMAFAKYGYDRYDAKNQVPNELVYYELKKVPRIESWNNMIQYKYVISPLGNGLDCHRTWEAIILGCIPIVKTSVLDPLYEGLPVLIVNKWTDVTKELLDNYKPNYNNIEKIKIQYWIDKFRRI